MSQQKEAFFVLSLMASSISGGSHYKKFLHRHKISALVWQTAKFRFDQTREWCVIQPIYLVETYTGFPKPKVGVYEEEVYCGLIEIVESQVLRLSTAGSEPSVYFDWDTFFWQRA